MFKKCLIIISIFYMVLPSCCSYEYNSNDLEFTYRENSYFNHYKIGDLVYFISDKEDVDTFIVMGEYEHKELGNKCFLSKPPLNFKSITIKNLPEDNWHGTTIGVDGSKEISFQTLISITKFPLKKTVEYTINYREFYFVGDISSTEFINEIVINGIKIYNCYKIKSLKKGIIKFIYWTNLYGLTAYTDLYNETWVIKTATKYH